MSSINPSDPRLSAAFNKPNVEPAPPPSKQAKAPAEPTVADKATILSWKDALDQLPDIRADSVQKARQLVQQPGYPDSSDLQNLVQKLVNPSD